MKTEITPERQEHIVNYLMTSLSKKGVKMSQFAEMTGIDQVSLSKTKKEGTRNLVSANVWNHLNVIYEQRSFDEVMQGTCIRFEPKRRVAEPVQESKDPKKQPETETAFEKYTRSEAERFEAMRNEAAKIPEQAINEKINEAISSEAKKAITESVKETTGSEKDETQKGKLIYTLEVLHESEITVGMAIDALIKAGAKVSISLEV